MDSNIKSAMALGALLLCAGTAHATSYAVTVSEGLTNGEAFDTATFGGFSGSNTAAARFTYTGLLNFDNAAGQNGPGTLGDLNSDFGFSAANITNYSGRGTVSYNGQTVANFLSLSSPGLDFLSSSGSAGTFVYGSLYSFDLGKIAAGTVLTITHDDGISLFENGTKFGNTVSGATSKVTDTVTVGTTGDIVMKYARENGTPSILQVSEAPVPEPVSWGVLAVGMAGLYSLRRPKRTAV